MQLRDETEADRAAVAAVINEAFKGTVVGYCGEAEIVQGLRDADALAVSLVAVTDGAVAGHVAFSPVTVGDHTGNWFGLGPLAVHPAQQRGGIGTALVRDGLARLNMMGAGGCVVFGDPAYYGRFGFAFEPGLTLKGAPVGYFMALPLGPDMPSGEVRFHPAFDVASPDLSG